MRGRDRPLSGRDGRCAGCEDGGAGGAVIGSPVGSEHQQHMHGICRVGGHLTAFEQCTAAGSGGGDSRVGGKASGGAGIPEWAGEGCGDERRGGAEQRSGSGAEPGAQERDSGPRGLPAGRGHRGRDSGIPGGKTSLLSK